MTAEHPGRVQRLVLYGSFAHGPGIADDRAREAIVSVVRSHWGVGWRLLTGVFFPDGDAEDLRWFARFQRDSATPEMAAALLEGIYQTEAQEAFKRVSSPTLVLHRRDDRAIPFELGVEVASLVPRARFKSFAGSLHLPWRGDVEALLAALSDFMALGEYAFAAPPHTPVELAAGDALSAREVEVLRLVAEGLSDKEIARRLYLSPHTVHRHVANIRTKLGQPSRAAAAAAAARRLLRGGTGSVRRAEPGRFITRYCSAKRPGSLSGHGQRAADLRRARPHPSSARLSPGAVAPE
jgi:DNA-binding CsgD family transcriptional regulator